MLSESTPTSVTYTDAVQHPSGFDGADFLQEHTYGVAEDGSVYYATGWPPCCNPGYNDGYECQPEARTKEEATKLLRTRLSELEQTLEHLRTVVAAFEQDAQYNVYWDGEPGIPEDEEDD